MFGNCSDPSDPGAVYAALHHRFLHADAAWQTGLLDESSIQQPQ
jgi:hypothetical protein